MKINRQKVLKVFGEYVDNYDSGDEKVRLKIEHTYRVSELCENIARSLKLKEEECSLAWLLGMLHDIGRFEQLKQYGTFADAKSIDHAMYGAEILFAQGKIRDYIDDDREDGLLETAVANHSAYRLPEGLDEKTRMFSQILRDGDKIDILKVNVDFPLEEIYNVSTKELRSAEVREEVMEAFKEGHAVLRSLKRTPADHVVGHISLVYELVYPRSYALVREQGYVQQLMDFQSENQKTQEQFRQIREIMNAYLQRKDERTGVDMKEYKNYIFDLYGTLVDIHTNETKASLWKNMAVIYSMLGAAYEPGELKKRYKKLVHEEISRMKKEISHKYSNELLADEEIEILLEKVFRELFMQKGIEADDAQIRQIGVVFRSLSMEYLKLFEGVPELLMRLKNNGKKIYLLSNAQRMFTEPEMKMLGIYDSFDGIFYSSDAGVKKPSFHFYDALFKKYHLKKEESVMIGNEYHADIYGADRYGIDSMYVFTAQSGEEPSSLPDNCRRLKQISEVYCERGIF